MERSGAPGYWETVIDYRYSLEGAGIGCHTF